MSIVLALFGAACSSVPVPEWQRRVPERCPTVQDVWTNLAALGDARAEFKLGLIHETGGEHPQDDAQAALWYAKSAAQGYPQAQDHLGQMYLEGRGVPRDPVQGADWIRKAAEQGDTHAQNDLSALYTQGLGVPIDADKAATWHNKAAGSAPANQDLGPPSGIESQAGSAGYFRTINAAIAQNFRYPERSRRNDQEGSTLVLISFTLDGTIRDADLLKGSGYCLLDMEALQVFSRIARFPAVPPVLDPRVRSFSASIPISFTLTK